MGCKLLIVDDEPIISRGLAETIPWKDISIDETYTALDGKEAMDILSMTAVDIVLTDVNMPFMNGLQLAEEIMKQYPDIKVIILSGYDDFEYARGAMRYKVKDYLLKPVNVNELMERIKGIVSEIEHLHSDSEKNVLQMLLTDMIYKKQASCTEMPRGILLATEVLDASWLNMISKGTSEELVDSWLKEVEKFLSKLGIAASVFTAENRLVTYVKTENAEELINILPTLNQQLEKVTDVSFISAGCHFSSGGDTFSSDYQLLMDALGRAAFTNENVFSVTREKEQNITVDSFQPLPAKLLNMLKREAPDFSALVSELMEHAEKESWTSMKLVDEIMTICEQKLMLQAFHHLFHEGIVLNTADQLQKSLLGYFQALHEKLMTNYQQGGTSWLMVKAAAYIKEHFNKDLKASEVADVIHVSPNYFSQVIKQETGMHFNDYLHSIRLEHAKELLQETSYRVFEIGEMVGYKDYKYFVHIFKRLTGESPTQFRKSTLHIK
ncbi:response regulator transcription factor [Jeotgalibacillus proteolyticus]|uniref:DNA-binding response regulator n=1 Tax=Jeotgalibacillus proteolyticus TaxID=2082395 RepID=A0A2S5G891_9BACL|nr:response regulator transcription factor [Jeotgalibacillus proteolyticus]PPA69144.1 hypothetical protein C4B60_17710 [Jeotgalibacillus proteolyticus]